MKRAGRPNISEDLAATLSEMIFDGRLAPGARVNEVHLAGELGISRTPLREALTTLAAEGAFVQIPRRGTFVRELTVEEATSIYGIRAILDPEALRLAGLPDGPRLRRLDALNDRLSKALEPNKSIRVDDAWHRTLWEKCPNATLVELIEQFMRRTRRYELAYMGRRTTVPTTTGTKREVVELLRAGDLRSACARLRRGLENGLPPVLEWLSLKSGANGPRR